MVDALGNVIEQQYDIENNTFVQIDRNGNPTTLLYDDRGNITEETNALGGKTLYEYNDADNPRLETAITDANGNTTRYEYDNRGNVILQEEPGGIFTQFQYDSFNNIVRTVGPATTVPGDGYADTLIDSSFADDVIIGTTIGQRLTDSNNGAEFVTNEVDSADIILGAEYDPDFQTPRDSDYVVLADGDYVTVGFDEQVTDRDGDDLFVITPLFSGLFVSSGGRAVVSVTTDGTNFVDVKEIELGPIVGIDLADSGIVGDVLGVRITGQFIDDGNPLNDRFGLTAVQTALGDDFRTTRFVYDANGNLTETIDAFGNSSFQTNDEYGRPLTITDRRGNTTQLEYNQFIGSPSKITNPDGTTQEFTYDDNGRPLTQTNELGVVSRAEYDKLGNLTVQTNGLMESISYEYDVESNLTALTDSLGNSFSLQYNERNELSSSEDPAGNLYGRTYDGNGNVLTETDPNGGLITRTYDALDNLLTIVDQIGNTRRQEYDATSLLVASIDGLGHRTNFSYDVRGNLEVTSTSRTDSEGNLALVSSTTKYDLNNNVTEVTDPLGNKTTFGYGLESQLVERTDSRGNTDRYVYDENGNLIEAQHHDESTSELVYDSRNRLIRIEDKYGNVEEREFDLAGRLIMSVDFAGVESTYSYDDADRANSISVDGVLTTIETNGGFSFDPRTSTLQTQIPITTKVNVASEYEVGFSHNAIGQLVSATEPNGNVVNVEFGIEGVPQSIDSGDDASFQTVFDAAGQPTGWESDLFGLISYELDANGRTTKATDSLGNITIYEYDELGNRTYEKDANGNETRWEYDNGGRIVKRILPSGSSESFNYSPQGDLLSHTDFNGSTSAFTYDEQGRLLSQSFGDGELIERIYGEGGQIESYTDPHGTYALSYDSNNRLIRIDNPDNSFVEYEYDSTGRPVKVGTNHGSSAYTFNGLGEVESVVDSEGRRTTYLSDQNSNTQRIDNANGTYSVRETSISGRLISLQHFDQSGGQFDGYSISYDDVAKTQQVVEFNGRILLYTFDTQNRLIEEVEKNLGQADKTTVYEYDSNGNRISRTTGQNATLYTYDQNDRLLLQETTGGDIHYAYDANGNLLSKTSPDGEEKFEYNSRNQLVSYTDIDGVNSAYGYDPFGNRTFSKVGSVFVGYVVDPLAENARVLVDVDVEGNKISEYLYGRELLGHENSDGEFSSYHADKIGSIISVTNAVGEETDSITYDSFGALIDRTGDTHLRFGFTGEALDHESGLIYLRARYLDPQVGRFATQDQYQGDIALPVSANSYVYANSNPIKFTDPTGFVAAPEYASIGSRAVIRAKNLRDFGIGSLAVFGSVAAIAGYNPIESKSLLFVGTSSNGVQSGVAAVGFTVSGDFVGNGQGARSFHAGGGFFAALTFPRKEGVHGFSKSGGAVGLAFNVVGNDNYRGAGNTAEVSIDLGGPGGFVGFSSSADSSAFSAYGGFAEDTSFIGPEIIATLSGAPTPQGNPITGDSPPRSRGETQYSLVYTRSSVL